MGEAVCVSSRADSATPPPSKTSTPASTMRQDSVWRWSLVLRTYRAAPATRQGSQLGNEGRWRQRQDWLQLPASGFTWSCFLLLIHRIGGRRSKQPVLLGRHAGGIPELSGGIL